MVLFVLFEHASGYAIFKSLATEEIGGELAEVQESVTDLSRFGRLLKLQTFQPFKTGANALENINSISEGLLHEDLETFLESNIPMGKKASKVTLGVSDAKIGSAVQERLHIVCQIMDPVPELMRGIRLHFAKLIKGLTGPSAAKAQLGLGHSYSRAKVKFNAHRVDNMIIQSIALLDQLDKDINTFSMRMREWYSYHFPELIKIVGDNYLYARTVQCIQSRRDLTDDKLEKLEEILMDSAKVKAVQEAARTSMGMDISPLDLINIQSFANRVIALADYRRSLHDYLHKKMIAVAPNLAELVGDQVGARLISHAGSLTNLAKYPASTVQILGAEKALFRALKTRGNTPKYGLIYHSTFIGRATAKNKGRVSRCLANKCSLASRIDCFTDQPTNVFGAKLRDQIEERLQFYETGGTPRKNIDVMQEAIAEAAAKQSTTETTPKKKKKKKAKKDVDEAPSSPTNAVEEESQEEAEEVPMLVPKKKKKHRESDVTSPEETKQKKSRKRKKSQDPSQDSGPATEPEIADTPKSAKKKKKATQKED